MEPHIYNFMPGPVNLHPEVKKIYHDTFLSHRSEKFYSDVKDFQQTLCEYVNAKNVAFFVGSGSLGNEVVAQYLKQLSGKGLILVNGEFGRRLKDQATHVELNFDTLEYPLGETFNYDEIEAQTTKKNYEWLWFVNCETSSGVLNELDTLKRLGASKNIKIAVDCISTLGNIAVDLSGTYLASGTSGKGLASYPGISLVFFSDVVLKIATKAIPKYMNLKFHTDTNLVPYTISTNLFYALVHAFKGITNYNHHQKIKDISNFIYTKLKDIGFTFLGNESTMMPGIISIVCPPEINSHQLGVELEKNNFYVNFGGSYLVKGNYFQICIMGHHDLEVAKKLIAFLKSKHGEIGLKIAS
jgi:aspartate aminotransferase-like enzyme